MSDMPLDEIEIRNQAALEELAQTIELSVGAFHIFIVRCNYNGVRSHLISRLLDLCSVPIRVLTLDSTIDKLYARIRESLGDEPTDAVLVVGFEHIRELDQLFAAADFARDEFRKNLPFPLVFWLSDDQFKQFKDRAPNFANLAPADTLVFAIAPNAILDSLEKGRNTIFEAAFDPTQTDLPDAINGISHLGELQRSELPQALELLDQYGYGIRADLQADLDFIQGCYLSYRNPEPETVDAALDCFQRAILHYRAYLPTLLVAPNATIPPSPSTLKLALALFFQGRCQFMKVDLARRISHLPYTPEDWAIPYPALAECVELFDRCDRPDMTAKVILRLARTLRRMERWDELETVVQRAIALHSTYNMPLRMGETHGFLAEIALERQQWTTARDYAQQAIAIIRPLPPQVQWAEGMYLRFWAKAEAAMGNLGEAVRLLEQARELGDRGHPTIYCTILESLRDLYWEQKRYLDAFEVKYRILEEKKAARICAFVGAIRLGRRADLFTEDNPDTPAPEIEASGRQQDIERMRSRIGDNNFKLTVIYGSSGVGKSSLVNAGLIPTLQRRSIGTKDNRVMLIREYNDWIKNLLHRVAEVLGVGQSSDLEKMQEPTHRGVAISTILEQLRDCDRRNLRPVLIFDQFEEFFFANLNPLDRRRFFEFLAECLQIPFINVILSLREDYIHFLLEANRIPGMEVIGNDILSNRVLYGLGNFSPQDAKAIIEDLTGRSRLYLEPALIDTLVDDLAGELREVRPIELQVVGAQLETEDIHTLTAYRALGAKPKEELVTRYLQEVVEGCGEEYAALAVRVLYQLTDERGTRPLKTHPELQRELEAANFPLPLMARSPWEEAGVTGNDALDYVLRMLTQSGIVMYLPEEPSDRYQLIHDYIAEAIREKYAPNTAAELAVEREKRLLAESLQQQTSVELEQAKKKNLKARQRFLMASCFLVASLILAGGVGLAALIAFKETEELTTAMKRAQSELKDVEEARRDAIEAQQKASREARNLKSENTKAQGLLKDAERRLNSARKAQTEATRKLAETDARRRQAEISLREAELKEQAANQNRILAQEQEQIARQIINLERSSIRLYQRVEKILAQNAKVGQIDLLIDAVEQIKSISNNEFYEANTSNYSALLPFVTLQRISNSIREKNRFQHEGIVDRVAVSSDGHHILTISKSSEGSNTYVWKSSGELAFQLDPKYGEYTSAAFSPNGQFIFAGVKSGQILLFDSHGNFIRSFLHEAVNARIPSETSYANSTLKQSTISNAEFSDPILPPPDLDIEQANEPTSIAISRDGQYVLVGFGKGQVVLWKFNGEHLHTLTHGAGPLTSVSFSPNGRYILTGSLEENTKIWKLTPIATGGITIDLKNTFGENSVQSASFSPDGHYLLTGSSDDFARLWSFRENSEDIEIGLERSFSHSADVTSASFSSDGKYILTSALDNRSILWELDGTQVQQFQHPEPVKDAVFSPDGNQIYAASSINIYNWLTNSNNWYRQFAAHPNTAFTRVLFSPSGKYILTSGFSTEYYGLARFSSSERRSDLQTKAVLLWSRDDLKEVQNFAHNSTVYSIDFSPDGKYILTGAGDGRARLWSINGDLIKEFYAGNAVEYAAFDREANYVITASLDRRIILWSMSGEQVLTFNADSRWTNFDLNSNSNQLEFLTSYTDGSVLIGELSQEKDATSFSQAFSHEVGISEAKFSPDGSLILAGAYDGSVILWNRETRSKIVIRGDSAISSANFSPDGKLIVTSSLDGNVSLWTTNGEIVQEFQFEKAVYDISFNAEGSQIIAGFNNGEVAIWEKQSLDSLITSSCNYLRDYLSYNSNVTDAEREVCDLPTRSQRNDMREQERFRLGQLWFPFRGITSIFYRLFGAT